MKWKKGGLIYKPDGSLWWAKTHAHLPTAALMPDGFIRVYFDSLDENQFGRIGYLDLDPDEPCKILRSTPEPVFDLGALGSFDDSGVNPSCVVNVGAETYLYYIGWQRTERVPYMLFTGLAISRDGGDTFERYSRVPILDRTEQEPFTRATPCVRLEDDRFRMWYYSCDKWTRDRDHIHYNNSIRCAESSDGIHWTSMNVICLAPEGPEDYSIGRPSVLKDGRIYKMWFSVRSKSLQLPYRIGYAESEDGLNWKRLDEQVGITPSESGWDSQMICYPSLLDVNGRRYLFYCGNGLGAEGFGYAVLEAD